MHPYNIVLWSRSFCFLCADQFNWVYPSNASWMIQSALVVYCHTNVCQIQIHTSIKKCSAGAKITQLLLHWRTSCFPECHYTTHYFHNLHLAGWDPSPCFFKKLRVIMSHDKVELIQLADHQCIFCIKYLQLKWQSQFSATKDIKSIAIQKCPATSHPRIVFLYFASIIVVNQHHKSYIILSCKILRY